MKGKRVLEPSPQALKAAGKPGLALKGDKTKGAPAKVAAGKPAAKDVGGARPGPGKVSAKPLKNVEAARVAKPAAARAAKPIARAAAKIKPRKRVSASR